MHKRIITIGLGAAMLAASVACGSVASDDTLRSEWRYGFYAEQIASGNMSAVRHSTFNANGSQHHAALALDDFYAGSCAAATASN
jgi:hypothetical protein